MVLLVCPACALPCGQSGFLHRLHLCFRMGQICMLSGVKRVFLLVGHVFCPGSNVYVVLGQTCMLSWGKCVCCHSLIMCYVMCSTCMLPLFERVLVQYALALCPVANVYDAMC